MYFSIQRVVAFLIGVGLSWLSVIFLLGSDGRFGSIASFGLIGLFGLYVIIASLVPYRATTETIADEVIWRIFIELPFRLILRVIAKLLDAT